MLLLKTHFLIAANGAIWVKTVFGTYRLVRLAKIKKYFLHGHKA